MSVRTVWNEVFSFLRCAIAYLFASAVFGSVAGSVVGAIVAAFLLWAAGWIVGVLAGRAFKKSDSDDPETREEGYGLIGLVMILLPIQWVAGPAIAAAVAPGYEMRGVLGVVEVTLVVTGLESFWTWQAVRRWRRSTTAP